MTQLNDLYAETIAFDNVGLESVSQTGEMMSIHEASSLLEVSPATVRNWQRHGYLSATTKRRVVRREVISLKRKLNSGELDRLQKRANKKQASGSFVPDEMVLSPSFAKELDVIVKHIAKHSLALEASLSVLALRLCTLQQEAVLIDADKPLSLRSYADWQRTSLKNEVSLWLQDIKLPKVGTKKWTYYIELFNLLREVHQVDMLGILYQSLLATGEKSKLGSYYTPQDIIVDILETHGDVKATLLDPCCGTGHFLLTAVRYGYQNPEHLVGFDMDAISVKIARLNLLFAFPDRDFVPKIYNLDALSASVEHLPETIDLIATNPPWGAVNKPSLSKDDLYQAIQSGESFSYFLVKCISLLEEGKRLSFILPESFLNVKQHADIRSYVLENCTLLEIHQLGRRFKGVYTPVIRMDLKREVASPKVLCDVFANKQHYSIQQARFASNQHSAFDIFLSPQDETIIQAFYRTQYTSLKDNAEWALGIVTGDNKKHIATSCSEGMEAIITGKEVQAYKLGQAQKFTTFDKSSFQQVAPEAKYRASEKLIYKFISKRLVFAYDDGQHLTLNSANCLIPSVPDMPTKVLLALLNSKAYQFFFEKSFHTHKVLRGDLEALPLVVLDEVRQQELVSLVESVLDGSACDVESVRQQIDVVVYGGLELTPQQITHIENS